MSIKIRLKRFLKRCKSKIIYEALMRKALRGCDDRLSSSDYNTLMATELSKLPEQVDADYISMCAVLESYKTKKAQRSAERRKKSTSKKALLTARYLCCLAVVAALVLSAASVNSKAVVFEIPPEIAVYDNGTVKLVDCELKLLENTAEAHELLDTPLGKTLSGLRVYLPTFPRAFSGDAFIISEAGNAHSNPEAVVQVTVEFLYKGKKGSLTVESFCNKYTSTDYNSFFFKVTAGEIRTVNGMEVLVLETELDRYHIFYKDGEYVYRITVETDNFSELDAIVDSIT